MHSAAMSLLSTGILGDFVRYTPLPHCIDGAQGQACVSCGQGASSCIRIIVWSNTHKSRQHGPLAAFALVSAAVFERIYDDDRKPWRRHVRLLASFPASPPPLLAATL